MQDSCTGRREDCGSPSVVDCVVCRGTSARSCELAAQRRLIRLTRPWVAFHPRVVLYFNSSATAATPSISVSGDDPTAMTLNERQPDSMYGANASAISAAVPYGL